jgi:hypothetical protein
VDEDNERLYLQCDEEEHGWWDPSLTTPIPFNADTGIGPRRLAERADLEAAGWDLSKFDRWD